ncbi:MAG TPA: ABC transporter substrate-binding protein [Candidatus Acidoferrales bacterium]|nr:ABC transporter substrate-binding protein [Candidatus Acidoferrales bacterium]
MRQKAQALFIALVIILILIGEAVVYLPYRSTTRSVTIQSYPSTSALVQALTNGEVDMAPIDNPSPDTILQLKNNPNLNIIPIGNFGFTYIGLNLRNSPLNNSIFRQAILYGFDRQRVLNDVLAGYGETLTPGLFSSAYANLGWRNDSINSYPYNPNKASQLLNSAGFVQSPSGVRVNPSTGQQLRTMFIFSKLSDPQAVAAANLFAQDMQSIGLPVISFPETDFDFNSQVKVTYYFDLYIDTASADASPIWLYDLFAGANDVSPVPYSTNLVGYHNATFNACATQLMTASNSGSAKTAALRCQEELSLDVPAIPVYSKRLLIVTQKSFPQISPITGSIDDTIAATITNMTGVGPVRIGEVSGLTDLNPTTVLAPADSLTLRLITEPLLTHSADGSPQPGLVDQWQMSDNSTKLTLVLRGGLNFQDGTPITAHDLVATLDWLTSNMVPSTPLYSTLNEIKSVSEVDSRTVLISLRDSDRFAVDIIANAFALPAGLLPTTNAPLTLMLSGALESSGAFTLVKFVQGSGVELRYDQPGNREVIYAVEGQDFFGSRIGGSQAQVLSQALTYEGEPLDNATFTVQFYDASRASEATIQGSYLGLGLYGVVLNLNDNPLPIGDYRVKTQLFAQLPSGAVIQFDQQTLNVQPPQLLLQLVVYVVAIIAIGVVMYNASVRKAKPPRRRRVTKRRKTRVKKSRMRR